MRDKRQAEPRPYGAINPAELLPLATLKSRLRWGDKTVAQAQRDGLPVLRYAKWGYVRGQDLIAFLERVGNEPAAVEGNGEAQL
jgi:hypothetical protein